MNQSSIYQSINQSINTRTTMQSIYLSTISFHHTFLHI